MQSTEHGDCFNREYLVVHKWMYRIYFYIFILPYKDTSRVKFYLCSPGSLQVIEKGLLNYRIVGFFEVHKFRDFRGC